ncbi:MAG: type II secretion system F family protein [Lysinibacillus sp.]
MKSAIKEMSVLFRGWEIVIVILWFFALNYQFFYLVSKERTISILVGIVCALFFFFFFTLKNRKLKNYQLELNELLKYVTNISFFLQTGENIYYAMKATKETVHPKIQKDIEESIQSLELSAVLKTDQFEKYDFPTLDQFHQNLIIKYEHGGDPKELFSQIQKNMIFELKKRDELYKKRKGFAANVYVLIGMVMSIELILRFMVQDLWDIFLGFGFAGMAVLLLTHLLALLNLYFLQKKNVDISVRY